MASKQVEWRKRLRETDPEKYKQLRARDRKLCAKARAASCRKWHHADPEVRGYARVKKWRESNPEKRLASASRSNAVRRARKRAGGILTTKQFAAIKAAQNHRCFDCGIEAKLQIGHMVPVCRGGGNDVSNIIAQCGTCNRKQGSKIHPLVGRN